MKPPGSSYRPQKVLEKLLVPVSGVLKMSSQNQFENWRLISLLPARPKSFIENLRVVGLHKQVVPRRQMETSDSNIVTKGFIKKPGSGFRSCPPGHTTKRTSWKAKAHLQIAPGGTMSIH
jgi:hypothetical protein